MNNCDENATCSNSIGGYNCKCKPDFIGDGITCHPKPDPCKLCDRYANCEVYGSDKKCVCRKGYVGNGQNCMQEEKIKEKSQNFEKLSKKVSIESQPFVNFACQL